jgi:hypothetical protein
MDLIHFCVNKSDEREYFYQPFNLEGNTLQL